jgi:cell division protein FtsI (penicillin-binding protein 3)
VPHPSRANAARKRAGRAVPRQRMHVGFLAVAVLISVFAVRLVQLQGLDAAAYAAQARELGVVEEVLPATRGTVRDRHGVALAESLDGMMIVADPTKTKDDAPEIATILQRRLDIDYIDAVKNLDYPDDDVHFRYIARRVPSSKARAVVEELDELGYKGIDVRRDPLRTYPGKDIAANLLGYTNREGEAVGGVEMVYDSLLSGKDGSTTYDVGIGGARIPLGDNSTVEPQDGDDLRMTIDRDVQFYAQRLLRQAVDSSRAESGSAIAMDVRTGELLAVADYPSYDANDDYHETTDDLGSGAFADIYEPGSVEKVFTAASLIEEGIVTPRTRITVPEKVRSSDRVIGDYFDHDTLRLTMTGVIAKSSNVGTVLAARKMPAPKLHHYLTKFGMTERVGIEGYGQEPGMLSHWSDWIQIERDNIAFGQGLAVTAMHMTAALNTLARGGEYIQPSVVQGRVVDTQGRATGSEVARTRRVVSPRTARQVTRMMQMVVDEKEGTAPAAAVPGYQVAGKTGTAQRVSEECGCYGRDFTVSFGGFAPADDPRFTVYVVVHKPQNGGGGGSTGGPVFRKLMGYLLQKYAVPPSDTPVKRLPVEWRPTPTEREQTALERAHRRHSGSYLRMGR